MSTCRITLMTLEFGVVQVSVDVPDQFEDDGNPLYEPFAQGVEAGAVATYQLMQMQAGA